jgi:hypothetical protein
MGIDADKYWIQPPNMNPKWEWIGMVKNHGMKILKETKCWSQTAETKQTWEQNQLLRFGALIN